MKNKEKEEIAKEAIETIKNVCEMFHTDFMSLNKEDQGLLIEIYRQGLIRGLKK